MNKYEFVQNALYEDIGRGDLFERTISKAGYRANVISKDDGIFAGKEYAEVLLSMFELDAEFSVNDGDIIRKGQKLLSISGYNTDILKLERTLLNMLQHASGIATSANVFAALAKEYGIKVLDTRKTRPGMRAFEKYAARVGGVTNHRFGLDDALMIKDTHLKAIGDLGEYMRRAKESIPFTSKIEIECESVEAAKEAIRLGADIVMCDNMSPDGVAEAVKYRDSLNNKILIECSGNINIENFALYAKSGADAVSIGRIIHQSVWLDFSMKGE